MPKMSKPNAPAPETTVDDSGTATTETSAVRFFELEELSPLYQAAPPEAGIGSVVKVTAYACPETVTSNVCGVPGSIMSSDPPPKLPNPNTLPVVALGVVGAADAPLTVKEVPNVKLYTELYETPDVVNVRFWRMISTGAAPTVN